MSYLVLSDILCIVSLALSLAFASSLALRLVRCVSRVLSGLMHYIFCRVSRLLGSGSRLSVVNLLVFSLYIIGLDKQSYVELAADQYRCFVGFVRYCWGSVLSHMVDLILDICLFISILLQYLSCFPSPLVHHHLLFNTIPPSTGPSTVHPIIARLSNINHSSGLT